MKFYRRSSEIVSDVIREERQWTWKVKALQMLEKRVNDHKQLFVTDFAKHCDWGFYAVMYCLLCYMIEYLRNLRTLLVLYSSPCERFSVHVKQYCRITLQR